MKRKALLLAGLLLIPLFGCTQNKEKPKGEEIDPDYQIVFNKNTHLHDGEITSRIGVHFHFDEKSVDEKSNEGFVTLKPFGGIYLQNYVPGIKELYVSAIYDGGYFDEGGYVVGTSSTPNSIEHYSASQTTSSLYVTPDKPYISIINRGNKDLIVEYLKFKYEEDQSEQALIDMIQVSDDSAKLDLSHPIKPYELHPIDESKIPSNRIVTKIGPEEYNVPGEYKYGYEVHMNLGEDGKGKLLYSSVANFVVKGTVDNKHLAIFHLENKEVLIPVSEGEKVDITLKEEISTYNWNSKFNDLTSPFDSDRHFYPVFNVVGVPTNKDGDGCYPIQTTYSLFDKKVNMPDPIMKKGYKFGGWFLDHECTKVFDSDAPQCGNLTLYAKCLETDRQFRKVYYYDYNTKILNRIDYLDELEEAAIDLPTFDDIGTTIPCPDYLTKGYEVRMGSSRVNILLPEGYYPYMPGDGHYDGDQLTYESIKSYAGDIKLYVVRLEIYSLPTSDVMRFFEDLEGNYVISGLAQNEFKAAENESQGIYDKILSARYIDFDPTGQITYNTYYDPVRCDTYFITDEVEGYINDGGLYNAISSHGYGNKYKIHSKPLYGLLRHDSIIKVNRRAFFNRYGLKGTYFPKNALEFDLEAYSNTHFNDYLLLPKSLKKIGKRCFVGSTNIHHVFLPSSIEEIGKGAFSLADYNEAKGEFENITYRDDANKIVFYYEGTEKDFNLLDEKTRLEIINNASKIIYEMKYNPCYSL